MIVPEADIEGGVRPIDYKRFFGFAYGMCGLFWMLVVFTTASAFQLVPSYWISHWADQDAEEQQKPYYPWMLAGIIALFMLISFLRGLTLFVMLLKANTNIHNAMIKTVLHAKILFFDSNPAGRILTRFSKDLGGLDYLMPILSFMMLQGITRGLLSAILVITVNLYIIPFLVILTIYMLIIAVRGSVVMQETNKQDGIARGPIHNTINMLVHGLVSVRSYDRVGFFRQGFLHNLNLSTNITFCNSAA